MDTYSIVVLLIAITVVIVNIMLIFAIFKIRDNSKRQLETLLQQTYDMQQIRAYLYLDVMKNIKDVQISRNIHTNDGPKQEVKVVSVADWIKGYAGGDTYKVENVK